MPAFAVNQPITTPTPTIVVDAGLPAGSHRFQLVVIDSAGNRSAADVGVVTIQREIVTGPVNPTVPGPVVVDPVVIGPRPPVVTPTPVTPTTVTPAPAVTPNTTITPNTTTTPGVLTPREPTPPRTPKRSKPK